MFLDSNACPKLGLEHPCSQGKFIPRQILNYMELHNHPKRRKSNASFSSQSKALCTKKNLSRSYVLMGGTGLLLALIYPLNRTVTLRWHCDNLLITISASQCSFVRFEIACKRIEFLLSSRKRMANFGKILKIKIFWRMH